MLPLLIKKLKQKRTKTSFDDRLVSNPKPRNMVSSCEVLKTCFSMKSFKSEIGILLLSLISSLFFAFLFLDFYYFKIDFVLVGVFRELLTIPFLILQPILAIASILKILKKEQKTSTLSYVSLAILVISIFTTYYNFLT